MWTPARAGGAEGVSRGGRQVIYRGRDIELGGRAGRGAGDMTDRADVVQVNTLATELLDEARKHDSRRTAKTIVSGTSQRVTLIALAEGAELAEHEAPPAATLQVITGRVRLRTTAHEWLLNSGDLAAAPRQRHSLQALTDAAGLLTVALR